MFYVAYFKNGVPSAGSADHLPLQRRAGLIDACGCTWAPSAPGGWSPATTATRRPRPTGWWTTPTACWTPATWCSSTPRAPASAASPARTRRRPSAASTPTPTPSAEFILGFLSQYGRWNSPKYLFGESYGTPRSAVLVNALETDRDHRFQRRGAAVADPEFRPQRRRAGVQSGQRRGLYHRPADLCRHRLVPQPPAGPAAGRAGRLPAPGRAVRRHRLRRRPAGRLGTGAGPAPGRGREAGPIHRPAGGLCAQGRPEDQRRRVREDPAGRRRHDHRAAGQPLFRPDHGPAEQGGQLRSAVGGDQLGLCLGVQRLCPQDARLRRGARPTSPEIDVGKDWRLQAPAARRPTPVRGASST